MKLETFFENFDQFTNAPNAVAKMRELIRDLATTGRLVPRKGEWKTRPLNSLATKIGSGATPAGGRESYFTSGIPLIRSMNVHFRGFNRTGLVFLSLEQAAKLSNVTVQPDDVLLNITGASIGRVTIAPAEMAGARVNQHVTIIRPTSELFPRYLSLFLASPSVQRMIDEIQVGVTRQALTKAMIEQFEISLPPLADQKRIVERVDELMALCDRLESQQQERESRHAALAHASLARFADAPTLANLNFLFHKSYPIPPSDLRNSILTLAVQGKLVPQDPTEESAERALRGCGVDLKQWAVAEEEKRQDVPSSWTWIRFAGVGERRLGKMLDAQKNRGASKPYLRNTNVQWMRFELDDVKEMRVEEREADELRLKNGDLLICEGGEPGRCAIWRGEIAEMYFQKALHRVRPCAAILSEFLALNLQIDCRNQVLASYFTGATIKHLTGRSLSGYPIPIPPLSEQRRIVAKVDELMTLVGSLEMQMASADTSASDLLEAVMANLVGIKRKTRALLDTINSMKLNAAESWKPRPSVEPLKLSMRSFVLRRFKMESPYRSLGAFDCNYHLEKANPNEASPICLVGLNGSGKSNLIEAIAEVFCFLELINLPWQNVESASSRYRQNRLQFELEYTIHGAKGERLIRIRKLKTSGAEFFVVKSDGAEEPVTAKREQLLLLPRRIIGYSSGLNETVSHPFLRTKTLYSEEVRDAAPPEGVVSSENDTVFDTRTLYMDYESNAAILICNFVFQKQSELAVINEFTRVRSVSSFGLHFNRKRARKSGIHRTVRLTGELQSYLKKFAYCAGATYYETQESYDFSYKLTPEVKKRFRKEFKTAEHLFMAMHKWSLLNALILSDEQRNVYLRSDITKGALERPPSVPPSDRVFDIVDLKLNLSVPRIEIDYSGLSDGEHQFIQIFGTAMLFSEPGTLFLLDEPESHFNPEWRTKFNLILNALPNASRQEYVISTHSPFIVSGSRKSNVYKFERNGPDIKFAPVDFETYGASFDVLLKKLFSIDSLIDESAKEELQSIIKRGKVQEMKAAVGEFAESKEKRKLYEAIITQEEKK